MHLQSNSSLQAITSNYELNTLASAKMHATDDQGPKRHTHLDLPAEIVNSTLASIAFHQFQKQKRFQLSTMYLGVSLVVNQKTPPIKTSKI